MNRSFAILPHSWTPDTNFWEFNGQLAIIPPFDKIYNIDKGGEESSKLMTIVFFISEPDEDKNRFARVVESERKKMLQETYYPDIDWEAPLLKMALEAYPQICLSAVGKILLGMKNQLWKRYEFINSTPYNLNNMKALDDAWSKTPKLFDDFERIEQKYIQEEKLGRVRGGRKETPRERGEL